MTEIKKELAKAVKEIRDSYDEPDRLQKYPKLMMTAVQMAKGTATINCGYHSHSGEDNEKAERILSNPTINELLKKYNGTMKKEKGSEETWQIRINY